MAQKWKIDSPNRLQLSEPGCRGGVGEGSVNYVYRIIVNVCYRIIFPKDQKPVIYTPEAQGLGGLANGLYN